MRPRYDFEGLVAALNRAGSFSSALQRIMPEARRRHSEAAADLAADLAARYGHPDADTVRRAALLHDVGRTLDLAALKGIACWHGWLPDGYEWAAGANLLHGPAGAAVARAVGLSAEGAAAVRYHVTGRPELALADKIVMAADAAEGTRRYAWAPAAREALAVSLELAVAFWVVLKVEKVRAAGLALHPRSSQTLDALDADVAAEARRLANPFL